MTDNEIVKALECNPLDDIGGCRKIDALSLVNRQKVEIERLKEAYAVYEETTGLKWAKSEAVKEFAERLKSTMFNEDFLLCEPCDMANIIDNLAKEMTEDEGNDNNKKTLCCNA